MNAPPPGRDIAPNADQQPIPLLAGMFVGFASVLLTFGFLWPFAPLFPAVVAAIAWIIPVKNHTAVARGAFYSCLGVVCFEVVFALSLLLS
ncbi:hypothetical protein B1R94_02860 [Mycolicibacterium litorale]|nr:hypothetical protein B1R94_02860 [Mycolicibacterium litorale]